MPDELTEKIIAAAIEVHRVLGPGLLEGIYQDAFCHELSLRGIEFEVEKPLPTFYKGIPMRQQRIDILVEGQVIVEIKSLSKLAEVHLAQVLSYLRATGLSRGLLINFGEQRLVDGVKRVKNFAHGQS